jgi:hypothetical protein
VTKAALKRLSAFCSIVSTPEQDVALQPAYIEVDDLSEQRDDDKDEQHIEKPLLELATILARGLGDNSGTETLSCNNTKSSDQTADGNVDHHGLPAVFWTQPQSNDNTSNDHYARVAEEAGRNDPLLHVLDTGDRRLLRGVYRNDDGPDDTVETSDFADKTQTLLQKNGGENGAYHDGQGSHRCDEDGVGKGISHEVTDLIYVSV